MECHDRRWDTAQEGSYYYVSEVVSNHGWVVTDTYMGHHGSGIYGGELYQGPYVMV